MVGLKEDRDAKIDALKQALVDFLTVERQRVERQIALIESLIEGRGVGAIQANVLNSLGEHAVDNLQEFLTG